MCGFPLQIFLFLPFKVEVKARGQIKLYGSLQFNMLIHQTSCCVLLWEMRQPYLDPPSPTQVLGRNKIVGENSPIYTVSLRAKEKVIL